MPGESGTYKVRAVHPDLLDRPVHGEFVISRVAVSPQTINLNIPINYEQTISIRANTGEGTEVNNLELVWEEEDQPEGVYPDGVHVTLGSPVSFVGSKGSATLALTIWADNTAAETGSLVLKVKSDETGEDAWATVLINTRFSEAEPVLQFTPDHVETGVVYDDIVTETIVLENKGLADLQDASLSLVMPDGTAAPNWVYLSVSSDLGTIPVGQKREVGISFSPTTSVSEGLYSFYLRLSSPD